MSEIKMLDVEVSFPDILDVDVDFGQTLTKIVAPEHYMGPFEFHVSDEDQVIPVKDKTPAEDICVKGITGEKTITQNGTYNTLEDKAVDVDVNPDLRPLSVSENGQYSPDGFDGYSDVTVDVPQEFTLDDLATGAKPTGDVVITAERITRKNAFYGLPMTTASFPNLTTVSGANSFQGCENLTLIDAPNLEVISGNGFAANCSNLVSVNLPNLREITGQATFQDTNKLKEIILPNVIKITSYIANGRNNTLYGGVIKLGKKAELGTRVFNACMKTGDIYLPWSEGEVSGAPWEAPTGVTIHYDTVYDEEWNVISST